MTVTERAIQADGHADASNESPAASNQEHHPPTDLWGCPALFTRQENRGASQFHQAGDLKGSCGISVMTMTTKHVYATTNPELVWLHCLHLHSKTVFLALRGNNTRLPIFL